MYQPGAYFMTQEDQSAAIGRLVLKFNQAKQRRAALMSECHTVGTALEKLGAQLRQPTSFTHLLTAEKMVTPEIAPTRASMSTRRTKPSRRSLMNYARLLPTCASCDNCCWMRE